MPVFSLVSSSMKAMLSLTASAIHAGRRAHLQLQHRAVVVKLLGRDAHLLAEELAKFVGHQAVVRADGAGLGAPPAEIAAVRQLGQPRDQRPVQVDFAVLPGGEQAAAPHVLEIQAAHDLGAKRGAVQLVVPAGCENMAGIRAGLTPGAMLHGQKQRLQEGPVILARKELVEARKEFADQLAFLVGALRPRKTQGAGVVKSAFVALASLRGEGAKWGIFRRVFERRRKRHEFRVVEVNQRIPVRAGTCRKF